MNEKVILGVNMDKTIIDFLVKFQQCVKEYRKVQRETRGDDDEIAHFFNASLKKWLISHESEIREMSKFNCEKPFVMFVIHNIYNSY